ncbi:alpha/beta fold hydrolase [Qipengyuania atrilutea]|uniref:Alpha/beta hydrolase n=1 Tax=Qipengyuania atrilutea TaxID=2744473 RepID=A0A850H8A0_9SPHN|nr:alpha/beta hydrolase [Actirhodobacter atriluteus]NVD45465.1 alpha/beta hydrolase [Actirhodobacter atriluteus]
MSHANAPGAPAIDRRAIPKAASESVWRAPDGHELRRIDWLGSGVRSGAARGSILFFPGRGDHYEKYLETLEEWHRAGWQVTAADWRGQAGSGRLGSDDVTGHIDDFATWVGDLAALWEDWKAATPGPHVLAGHSMGGHIVLRAMAERRVHPDVAVLSAPMLGFTGTVLPVGMMHGLARLMKRFGDAARPAWKWSEKPGVMPETRRSLLTHDDARYEDELWWREERPALVMGPGSWNWVERGYASMRSLYRPGILEAVTTPVLLIATTSDRLVAYGPIADAARRLPNATLVTFGEEARHEILREVDAVRNKAMAAIAEFLEKAAPAPR